MPENQKRILEMLAEKKITVEEAERNETHRPHSPPCR